MQSKNLIINILIYRFMNNNNELLKKYAGISTRIRRTFAYHYDQIQREVQTEISTLDPKITSTREIPLEQNKEVQTKIKEIIYNNLYDTLIDELKSTISRFQAQYNIQEINPYLQDILQNPEDLISRSNNKEYR